MDPHVPDNTPEGEWADEAPATKPQPGLAPAGSLMSIQIRRRTPSKGRPAGTPPAAAAAPTADTLKPRPAVPAPPVLAKPAPVKPAAAPQSRPPTPPAPAPAPIAAPQVPVAESAPPPSPAPPKVPAAGMDEAARRQPTVKPPPAITVRQVQAAPASPPPPPLQPTRSSPMGPGITRQARPGEAIGEAQGKAPMDIPTRPAPAPKAADEPPVEAPPPAGSQTNKVAAKPEPPARPEGIVSYWLRLRGHRRFPAKADLDQRRISEDWPNTILIRCRRGSKVLEPEKVFASQNPPGPAMPGSAPDAAMELSPMMLQWLLTLAGDAARDRRPMQDTEAFPSRNQSIRYGAIALPFSDDQNLIDHVLCHVYRAP